MSRTAAVVLAGDLRVRSPGAGEESVLERVAEGVFDREIEPRLARRRLADPLHHLIVALDGERVVGFASGVRHRRLDKETELHVDEIGVASGSRRRGVGAALLRALLEEARAVGCREAWLLTETENGPARRLFAAAGAREEAAVLCTFRIEGEGS